MSEIYYTGKLPVPYDIVIYQGETFALSFEYKDDSGVAVPLTDYEGQMQVREESSSSVLLDLNTTDGGISITAASGKVDISITAAQSAALETQNAKYDLLIKSPTNTITYLLKGDFVATPRITRESIPVAP